MGRLPRIFLLAVALALAPGTPSPAANATNDAWTIDFKYGDSWTITGIKLRAYADDTKPAAQLFGTIVRKDPSALP